MRPSDDLDFIGEADLARLECKAQRLAGLRVVHARRTCPWVLRRRADLSHPEPEV